jgi:4,5-DOPA dioxygenase extradiol
MYPEADIPVLQLSIDRRLGLRQHWELARSLADLRRQGVLIMGSGNIVHNLRDAFRNLHTGSAATPDWAQRFDRLVADAVLQGDVRALIGLGDHDDDFRLAHPTPDHWLPLIYALAVTDQRDRVRFSNEGFDLGSLSMRNVIWE